MIDKKQLEATQNQMIKLLGLIESLKEINPYKFWNLLSSESKGYLKGSYFATNKGDISRTSELSERQLLNDYVLPIVNKINCDLGGKYINNPQCSNYVYYIDALHVQGKIASSESNLEDELLKVQLIPLIFELAISKDDPSQVVQEWKIDLIEFYKLG